MEEDRELISKASVISNLFWKYSEVLGSQLVSFVVSIILARLLLPEEYGIVAILTVFIVIADTLVVSGFGNALIQKKDADDNDFSSVFYLSLGLSLLAYGLMFISSPYIAYYFDSPILAPVMRVLGLRVVIGSLNTVLYAYVSRKMVFKRFFFSTLSGTLTSGVIGTIMAFLGFGVWALVAQSLVQVSVSTTSLWCTVKWRPHILFSVKRIRSLFSYGWKLLIAGLLNTFQNQIYQLAIGKKFSAKDLAYYNKGMSFPGIIMNNVNGTISAVMFPVLAKLQDDEKRLKNSTRLFIRVSSFFVFPLMVGLSVIAEPLIRLLLTEKWIFCVPFLRIGCYIHAVTVMQIAIQNAVLAKGRSDIFLKMDILRNVLAVPLLLLAIKRGVIAVALSTLVTGTFSVLMVAVVSKRVLAYGYREHLKDNLPVLLVSLLMGVPVYFVRYFGFSDILTIGIQIPLGIAIYVIITAILRFDGYLLTLDYIKGLRRGGTHV